MGDHPTEETQFVVDEVSNVIKEAIETTIGGNSYTVRSGIDWTSNLLDQKIYIVKMLKRSLTT